MENQQTILAQLAVIREQMVRVSQAVEEVRAAFALNTDRPVSHNASLQLVWSNTVTE